MTTDEPRAAKAAQSTTSPRTVVEAFAAGRYRCHTHPDTPVTWRGRGCPECAPEVRDPRGRRRSSEPTP